MTTDFPYTRLADQITAKSPQYLAQQWLGDEGATAATVTIGNSTNALNSGLNTLQYITPSYTWGYYNTYARHIRLTLTEIETLRAVAKKDKKVKEILQKFGPHIEVEVDF